MRAVVLVNGQEGELRPLMNVFPKCMLPVVNRPFLEYTLRFLKRLSIEEVIFCLNQEHRAIADYFQDGSKLGLRLSSVFDAYQNGTAGCLKNLNGRLNDGPFVVMEGSLFLDADVSPLLEFHQNGAHLATVGVVRRFGEAQSPERIELNVDRTIRQIFHPYRSEGRSAFTSCGLAVFDPRVLDCIPAHRYFDLKEQLIPALARMGKGARVFEVHGFCRKLEHFEDFFDINRYVLFQQKMDTKSLHNSRGVGVWTEDGAVVSPNAALFGPLVIGKNAVIEKDAQIIGPVAIGEGCHVSRGTVVFDSVVLPRASLSEGARVEHSVIGHGAQIPESLCCAEAVVTRESLRPGEFNLIPLQGKLRYLYLSPLSLSLRRQQDRLYRLVKRVFDIAASFTGLVIFAPLFLLISAAIKLDSKGPVFFGQIRCGQDGREFRMVKFRSMIEQAADMRPQLERQNESDGPMFKMSEDPRLTNVGWFLRKFSLDELPQLLNVLKGEMTLVGPRPLEMKEMALDPAWREIRLTVKPGMTGLWQTHGRYEGSFYRWILDDTQYVKRRSLWLDIKILLKTLTVIVSS